MNSTEHTQGPWRLERRSYFDRIYGADGSLIVTAEITTPNAILMTAAPELLDALEDAIRQCVASGHIDTEPHMVHARAVIAKARGAHS